MTYKKLKDLLLILNAVCWDTNATDVAEKSRPLTVVCKPT
jgi:hypothetical protein